MQKQKIIIEGQETNYSIDTEGNVYNDKFNRILKGTDKRNEYLSVQLTINGKPKTLMVHRLVAETFLPNPNNYYIVDHIDRNKYNNKLENLRWVDQETNLQNREIVKLQARKKFDLKLLEQDSWKTTSIAENIKVNNEGCFINTQTGYVVTGSKRNDYIRININNHHYSAHRLVWEAFNGPIPEGMVIDHIDGNRSNNALSNLRLVTQSENMSNAQTNGHKGQVKISQYDLKGNFIATYDSIRRAADAINGNEVAIKDAANRMGSSSGFLWIKENQNLTIEEVLDNFNKKRKRQIKIGQYDKDNNLIQEYNSLKEAHRITGISLYGINKVIDEPQLYKDYYWKRI